MKKPKIKVRAVLDNKKDKKLAKLAEDYLNGQFDKFEGVITQIIKIREYLMLCYGPNVQPPKTMWDKLMEEVVKVYFEAYLIREEK